MSKETLIDCRKAFETQFSDIPEYEISLQGYKRGDIQYEYQIFRDGWKAAQSSEISLKPSWQSLLNGITAIIIDENAKDCKSVFDCIDRVVSSLELPKRESSEDCGKPYLRNRGDGVDGHYCIARYNLVGHYTEYWHNGKWCSAGQVYNLGNQIEAD
jgi:hypothetical protein